MRSNEQIKTAQTLRDPTTVVFRGRVSITPVQFDKPIRIRNSLRVDRNEENKRAHHIGRRGPA